MDVESVRELLSIIHSTMHFTRSKENFCNIPRREFFLMNIVFEHYNENKNADCKKLTVTEIATILSSATANTSRLLRNMEKKGYIERKFDDNDRRAVYIGLSLKGEEIIMNARKNTGERFYRIFEKMGDQDAEEFLRLSKKFFVLLSNDHTNTCTTDKGKMI